jgi:hypothetical protein
VKNEEQVGIFAGSVDEEPGNFVNSLKNNMQFNIISLTEDTVVFDLIGVDVSIANGLRRILLAEVF